MTRVLRCADVVPRCPVVIEGRSDAEVLARGKEHMRGAHHMDAIPPATLARVRAAIRDKKPRR